MTDHSTRLDASLIQSNLEALKEGEELIRLLEPGQYSQGFRPAFQSTIGAHFRHVLEHYRCFFEQQPMTVFNYDLRSRDQLLECDAEYALTTICELLDAFEKLSDQSDSEPAVFQTTYMIEDEQTSAPVPTSLNRELLFLQSHTVHHYAIIGAMTRAFGKQPQDDFGVAIATRVHNEKCVENPKALNKGSTCAQ